MVIVDTNVWLDFFDGGPSITGESLGRLIRDREAVLVGVVLAELNRGARGEEERRALHRGLGGVRYLEMSRYAWVRAGRIAEELDRRGTPVPQPDIFIAALVLEGDHELFTRDRHFERIPGLRLYQPEGSA